MAIFNLIVFLFIFVLGLLLPIGHHGKVRHYKKKKPRFSWYRYIVLCLLPFSAVIWLTFKFGILILAIYATSAFLGMFLEALVGLSYYEMEGSKLWIYHRFSISGYTSYLTPPFWGFAGVLTFLIVKTYGF